LTVLTLTIVNPYILYKETPRLNNQTYSRTPMFVLYGNRTCVADKYTTHYAHRLSITANYVGNVWLSPPGPRKCRRPKECWLDDVANDRRENGFTIKGADK
jgi:hypothetical protein